MVVLFHFTMTIARKDNSILLYPGRTVKRKNKQKTTQTDIITTHIPAPTQAPFQPTGGPHLWLGYPPACAMADTLFACGAYSQKEPLPLSLPCFPSPPITYHAHNDSYFDTNGCPFRQLFQEFPALSPFYADFEKNFNAWSYTNWAERNMWLAWVICAGYLAFLYVGGKCMENRERFVLKKPLAAWNLALAIFSAIGFLRTAPHLLYYLVTEGFYSSVCNRIRWRTSRVKHLKFTCNSQPRV